MPMGECDKQFPESWTHDGIHVTDPYEYEAVFIVKEEITEPAAISTSDEEYRAEESDRIYFPPGKKRRRDPRPAVILSDSEVDSMAEFLQSHPGIYDKAKDMWRDTQTRVKLFQHQASTMNNRTGPQLQQWYEGLRTKLGRLKKRLTKTDSGSGVMKDSHKRLLDNFSFILSYISEGQRRSNIGMVSLSGSINPSVAKQ